MTNIEHDREWLLDEDIIYLNHAAVAPWPRRTRDAVNVFAEENTRRGSKSYPAWINKEEELRRQLAQLIGIDSGSEISLLKNTSEGLSIIAYGLTWKDGDNIVISDQEFPSNRIVWQSLADKGVEVREVDLYRYETPEQALVEACDKNTRLLSISSIQFASGLRMNLEILGDFCKEKAIFFCIDAIQSLGAEPFYAKRYNADFVVADGHKWMLGPEGLAMFYCRADRREQIKLNQFGWHMVENVGDYSEKRWQIADNPRRFECGSPNMLCIHALSASLSLLLETGLEQVHQELVSRTQYLMQRLESMPGIKLLTLNIPERYCGILTFTTTDQPIEELFKRLTESGVFCAQRGGGVRLSPHYYTPYSCLDYTIGIIKDFTA